MKTNQELIATLNMILARLEADKHNAAEWETMRSALASAEGYARKCRDMRAALEAKLAASEGA